MGKGRDSDIKKALKRMVKVLTLCGYYRPSSQKVKDIVKQFAKHESITINTASKFWHLALARECYNNPASSIFKGNKLPIIKLTKEQTAVIEKKKDARRIIYEKYLKSAKWINFRNKIKESRGNKCEKCGIKEVELHGHHLTYDRFMNELESDIQIVCKPCHKKIHEK